VPPVHRGRGPLRGRLHHLEHTQPQHGDLDHRLAAGSRVPHGYLHQLPVDLPFPGKGRHRPETDRGALFAHVVCAGRDFGENLNINPKP
jgi:hypothetical protein